MNTVTIIGALAFVIGVLAFANIVSARDRTRVRATAARLDPHRRYARVGEQRRSSLADSPAVPFDDVAMEVT